MIQMSVFEQQFYDFSILCIVFSVFLRFIFLYDTFLYSKKLFVNRETTFLAFTFGNGRTTTSGIKRWRFQQSQSNSKNRRDQHQLQKHLNTKITHRI